MKRTALAVAALVLLAGNVGAQGIEYRPPSSATFMGLPHLTKTVTVSAVRSRTLFSDPLEFLPAVPGYAYYVFSCSHSHPAGTNHTTSSVTAYGVYYEQGLVGAFGTSLGPATMMADGSGNWTYQTGPPNFAIGNPATSTVTAGTRLLLRTAGADLSGSGTYDMTTSCDYLLVPAPGANMVWNSGFTGSATGWTLGAGGGAPDWAYSSNTVTHGDGGGTGTLRPSTALTAVVAGHSYQVTFTMSGWSAGTVTPTIGGTAGTARGSSATFTETIVASTTGNLLFTPTTTLVATIDNVFVIDLSAP